MIKSFTSVNKRKAIVIATALVTAFISFSVNAFLVNSIVKNIGGGPLYIHAGAPIHEEITRDALGDTNFSVDLSVGRVKFSSDALETITYWNRDSDSTNADSAAHHSDADEFIAGGELLRLYRKQIVEYARKDTNSGHMHYLLGYALHAAQDFYAHTNWIDIHPSYSDLAQLGRSLSPSEPNLIKTPEEIGATCNFFGPVVPFEEGGPLISGFFKTSQIFNPVKLWSTSITFSSGVTQSKCTHGGLDGGVGLNKDSPARTNNYDGARARAVLATRQYVQDIVSDLAGNEHAICVLLDDPCKSLSSSKPITIISGIKNPTGLFVDGSDLYFGELDGSKGTFNKVARTVGVKKVLATNTVYFSRGNYGGVVNVDAAGSRIYFSYGNYDVTRIEEIARDGTNRRLLMNVSGGGLAGVLKPSSTATDIYLVKGFSSLTRNRIGGVSATVFNGLWPRNYVRDGQNLYFANVYNRNVYRSNMQAGGAPTLLVSGNAQEGLVAVNSSDVFVGWPGTVRKIPKLGGAVTNISVAPDSMLRGVDDNYMYFSNSLTNDIRRKPVSGIGVEIVVAANTRVQERVLVNGGSLYWIDDTNLNAAKILTMKAP